MQGTFESRTTKQDGSFFFGQLDPESYALIVRDSSGGSWREPGSNTGSTDFKHALSAGQDMDVGDLDLSDGSWVSTGSVSWEQRDERYTLHIESGQSGLEVCVSVRGGKRGKGTRTTDAEGKATLRRSSSEAIRIDLVDRNGYVMGSTDTYQRYPMGLETLVVIPAVPGVLSVRLPVKVEVRQGEKDQIHLTRTSSPQLDLIVKSITRGSPRRRRGVRSSVDGIEFEALRPGSYSIKAIRRIMQASDGLSTPSGAWLHGAAQVFPGQVTTCTLH